MEGDWTTRAACRGVSLSVFFADEVRQQERALAFCAACPVTADCLAMAVEMDGSEAYGVFGGRTGRQRTVDRLARQREAA